MSSSRDPDIDHCAPRQEPRTNGLSASTRPCSRVLSRRVPQKVYRSIDELQADLDVWVREYNEVAPHQRHGASARRR
jgi:hypothetical protein